MTRLTLWTCCDVCAEWNFRSRTASCSNSRIPVVCASLPAPLRPCDPWNDQVAQPKDPALTKARHLATEARWYLIIRDCASGPRWPVAGGEAIGNEVGTDACPKDSPGGC
jgi:hypothetical protein